MEDLASEFWKSTFFRPFPCLGSLFQQHLYLQIFAALTVPYQTDRQTIQGQPPKYPKSIRIQFCLAHPSLVFFFLCCAPRNEVLKEVQGYLVEFPLDFLQQEDLTPSVMHGLLGPVFTWRAVATVPSRAWNPSNGRSVRRWRNHVLTQCDMCTATLTVAYLSLIMLDFRILFF